MDTRLAERAGVERADAAEWQAMGADVRDRLFRYIRPAAQREIAEVFAALTSVEFTPSLIHGDFGTGNLLFDPDTEQMSGVIDFDGACIGDPATDVAALMSYGEDFAGRFTRAYGCSEEALRRARLYRETFALQEALFGARHGDADALAAGLADYV